MPIPFQASSWTKRADHGLPARFGSGTGSTGGAVGGSLEPQSKVVQIFGPFIHHTESWFNLSMTSLNEGKAWTLTRDHTFLEEGTGLTDVVARTFSLVTPGGTFHYEMRWNFWHSFFLADGSLHAGYMRLYISEDGLNFSPLQDLYTWPSINAIPANTGGQAAFNTFPGCTAPIFIEGSGPNGEDAWWLAANVTLTAGGNTNPYSLQKAGLWYSLNGITWTLGNDLSSNPIFSGAGAFSGMFRAANGRTFISSSVNLAHTDDDDLFSATWSNLAGQFDTEIYSMFGGTLLTAKHGSLITGGWARVSCDNGASFVDLFTPDVPVNFPAFPLKIGPSEAIIITNGGGSPTTETVTYYSSDGGETWAGGEVWNVSDVGERVAFAQLKSDGRPLVVTRSSVYISSDTAQGIVTTRTVCPLANAGIAKARRLVLCGGVITPDCMEG